MHGKLFITLTACGLLAAHAFAFTPEPPLQNAQQEHAAQSIFHELRCVVCEGQSLAESDATLARQMRAEVRRRLREGESPDAILDFFRSHYGDAVLMRPPLDLRTSLLWGTPLLLVLLGAGLLLRRPK